MFHYALCLLSVSLVHGRRIHAGKTLRTNGHTSIDLDILPGGMSEEAMEATIELSRALAVHTEAHHCMLKAAEHTELHVNAELQVIEEYERKLILSHAKKKHWFEILVDTPIMKMVSPTTAEMGTLDEQSNSIITSVLKDLTSKVPDYDKLNKSCMVEAGNKFEVMQYKLQAELANGCSGACSKTSKVKESFPKTLKHGGQCREKQVSIEDIPQVCPEGTYCTCVLETNPTAAAIAWGTVYFGLWGLWVILMGPKGSLMPGPMEAAMVAVLAFAQKSKGCGCKPSPCAWHEKQGACLPKSKANAMNPAQALLPALGTKCVKVQEATDGPFSSWKKMKFLRHVQCALEPCTSVDQDKLGRLGSNSFNCQIGPSNEDMPSVEERLEKYKGMWPMRFAEWFNRKGLSANAEGESKEALHFFLQALEVCPTDEPRRNIFLMSASNMYFKLGHSAKAKTMYEQLLSEIHSIEDWDKTASMSNLSQKVQFKLNLINAGKTYMTEAQAATLSRTNEAYWRSRSLLANQA